MAMLFLDLIILSTLSPDIRVHRAGSQLKNIAIARSEILLIISSRTSSCAHVPSITISCSVLANICNTNIHSTESRFVYTQLIFSSSIIIGLQASKGSETTKAKWPGFSTNTLL